MASSGGTIASVRASAGIMHSSTCACAGGSGASVAESTCFAARTYAENSGVTAATFTAGLLFGLRKG